MKGNPWSQEPEVPPPSRSWGPVTFREAPEEMLLELLARDWSESMAGKILNWVRGDGDGATMTWTG